MYKVRLDKYGVEFGARREEFTTLKSLYDWIEHTYGDKVGRWLLEEDGSGGDKMPPIENISHYVDNDLSVDLEGWLKKIEGGCGAYFFHIIKEQDLYSTNTAAESMEHVESPEICDTEEFLRRCQQVRNEMLPGMKPLVECKPGMGTSIVAVLTFFEASKCGSNLVSNALASIANSYGMEVEIPDVIREIQHKKHLTANDYVILADECLSCIEEQLAAQLYAAGYYAEGDASVRGSALVKLADLYINSAWSQGCCREVIDVMNAVDILSEAQMLGCHVDAMAKLEQLKDQIFGEFHDQIDMDSFVNDCSPQELCFAAYCIGEGIGWNKNIPLARQLYAEVLSQRYNRASYYLGRMATKKGIHQ